MNIPFITPWGTFFIFSCGAKQTKQSDYWQICGSKSLTVNIMAVFVHEHRIPFDVVIYIIFLIEKIDYISILM